MDKKQGYEDLKVWQKSKELVRQVYLETKEFPKEELYGITNQIRRAAVSIPLNIAEGKGRFHTKEYIQFLFTARGSVNEVMTLLDICLDLGYLKEAPMKELKKCSGEIAAMLNGLIQSLK